MRPRTLKDICPMAEMGLCHVAGCSCCVIHADEETCECDAFRKILRRDSGLQWWGFTIGVVMTLVVLFATYLCERGL